MSMFERTEVDPVSRCTQCGGAVAAGGQETHRAWHRALATELDQARRDIAELQQGRPS
jgi:hypothetical protein